MFECTCNLRERINSLDDELLHLYDELASLGSLTVHAARAAAKRRGIPDPGMTLKATAHLAETVNSWTPKQHAEMVAKLVENTPEDIRHEHDGNGYLH